MMKYGQLGLPQVIANNRINNVMAVSDKIGRSQVPEVGTREQNWNRKKNI